MESDNTSILRLSAMIACLPTPHSHYLVESWAEDGFLLSDAELKATERLWDKFIEGQSIELKNGLLIYKYPVDSSLVAWLKHHPLAWQSFDVLAGIVTAISCSTPRKAPAALINQMYLTLLLHAHDLLVLTLPTNYFRKRLMPSIEANRSAFQLLDLLLDAIDETVAIPVLKTKLTLCPLDRACRKRLARLLKYAGRNDDAVSLNNGTLEPIRV